MDPNATLKEIREQVRLSYAEEGFEAFDGLRLAELCGVLDEWLTRGGFLPKDWNHGGSDGSHQTR